MSAKDYTLQEARVLFTGTTYSDAFTAASHADWVVDGSDCYKVRFQPGPIDLSTLTYPRIEDPSARTRLRGRGVGILGQRVGGFNITHFLGASYSDQFALTMLGKIFGGTWTPTINSFIVESATTTVITDTGVLAAIGAAPAGAALLCGDKADGRGNGEVIPIASIATDAITLSRATLTAMTVGDVCRVSTTVYPDEDAAQEYFSYLLTCKDVASPAQYNVIGCAARAITFGGLNLSDGELPTFTIDVGCGDWHNELIGTVRAMDHTAAGVGADPAMDRSIGGLFVTDSGSAQTRRYPLGGMMTCDPDMTAVPLQSPQHTNAIGGWKKSVGNAKWSYVAYSDEGLVDAPIPEIKVDYEDDTHSKQIMMQFGHVEDACVALAIDNGRIDAFPEHTELNGCLAYKISGHAEEGTTTTDLLAADLKIHFFLTDAP